jgi:hypothetical protein
VCCSGFATCAAALQHSMLHQDPRRSAGTADRERTWAVACLFVCLFVSSRVIAGQRVHHHGLAHADRHGHIQERRPTPRPSALRRAHRRQQR